MALRVARLQAREGKVVTNSHHQLIVLDDMERHLVTILDGENDRQALMDSVREACASGALAMNGGDSPRKSDHQSLKQTVLKTLARLRDLAVLVG